MRVHIAAIDAEDSDDEIEQEEKEEEHDDVHLDPHYEGDIPRQQQKIPGISTKYSRQGLGPKLPTK